MFAYRIHLPAGVDLYGIDEDAMEYTDQVERIYADWQSQSLQRGIVRVYERRFGAMPDDLRETLGREERFGAMPGELRQALGRVHGERALLDLLAIVATRVHDEVVVAVNQAAGAN